MSCRKLASDVFVRKLVRHEQVKLQGLSPGSWYNRRGYLCVPHACGASRGSSWFSRNGSYRLLLGATPELRTEPGSPGSNTVTSSAPYSS